MDPNKLQPDVFKLPFEFPHYVTNGESAYGVATFFTLGGYNDCPLTFFRNYPNADFFHYANGRENYIGDLISPWENKASSVNIIDDDISYPTFGALNRPALQLLSNDIHQHTSLGATFQALDITMSNMVDATTFRGVMGKTLYVPSGAVSVVREDGIEVPLSAGEVHMNALSYASGVRKVIFGNHKSNDYAMSYQWGRFSETPIEESTSIPINIQLKAPMYRGDRYLIRAEVEWGYANQSGINDGEHMDFYAYTHADCRFRVGNKEILRIGCMTATGGYYNYYHRSGGAFHNQKFARGGAPAAAENTGDYFATVEYIPGTEILEGGITELSLSLSLAYTGYRYWNGGRAKEVWSKLKNIRVTVEAI